MLTGTNRDFVVEKITAKLAVNGRAWFLTFLAPASSFLANLPTTLVSAGDIARTALQMALENNGQAYPGVLLQLLTELATDPSLEPNLRPMILEVRTAEQPVVAPAGNPLDDKILAHKLLFWNRRDLRRKLQRIMPAAGRSILVVNGGSGAGKSYTVEMLTHLKLVKGSFVLAAVRPPLEPVAKAEMTPEALAKEMVSAMGLKVGDGPLPSRDGSSLSQFCDALCVWMFDRVPSNLDIYWIVLDGFGMEGVDPWVRAFIARFATKITAGVYQGRIRLILLNYPIDELASVQDHLEEDVVGPPSDDELKEVVRSGLTDRQLDFDDEDVHDTLSEARARVTVQQAHAQYWRQLNRSLFALLYD